MLNAASMRWKLVDSLNINKASRIHPEPICCEIVFDFCTLTKKLSKCLYVFQLEMLRLSVTKAAFSKTKGAFVRTDCCSFKWTAKPHWCRSPRQPAHDPHYLQRKDLDAVWAPWLIKSTADMPSTHIHSRNSKSFCTCFAVQYTAVRFKAVVALYMQAVYTDMWIYQLYSNRLTINNILYNN